MQGVGAREGRGIAVAMAWVPSLQMPPLWYSNPYAVQQPDLGYGLPPGTHSAAVSIRRHMAEEAAELRQIMRSTSDIMSMYKTLTVLSMHWAWSSLQGEQQETAAYIRFVTTAVSDLVQEDSDFVCIRALQELLVLLPLELAKAFRTHLEVTREQQENDQKSDNGFSTTAVACLLSAYVFLKASSQTISQPSVAKLLQEDLERDLGPGVCGDDKERMHLISRFGLAAAKLYKVKLNATSRPPKDRLSPEPQRVRNLRSNRMLAATMVHLDPDSATRLVTGRMSPPSLLRRVSSSSMGVSAGM